MSYFEIEDLGRIKKFGKELNKALQAVNVGSETRTIGYPSGHAEQKVFFLQDDKNNSLWYASWVTDDKKAVNLFGHGAYGSSQTLTIDVQFNYRTDEFTRRLGAAFLEDYSTGEIVLAHRGIVTLGQRVKKDVLFEALASGVVEADTSARPQEFLLLASLDSESLVDDISNFARNLRSTLREMGAEVVVGEEANTQEEPEAGADEDDENISASKNGGFNGLRAYFSEFSGKRRSFIPKQSYPVSNHGKVVDELQRQFMALGETLKSRAVDLVANRTGNGGALLFEVKTDSSSQNVYTAIGQLSVHTATVESFTGKSVLRVLVVPERPMRKLAYVVEKNLKIHIVTYSLSARGRVTFEGLERLLSTFTKLDGISACGVQAA